MNSKYFSTSFCRLFHLRGPLIVAPLGGGPTTPELVAASCQAGALGSLAAAYLQPDQISEAAKKVRSLTQKPFAINLFTPMPSVSVSQEQMQKALDVTRVDRKMLGLPDPEIRGPYHPDFEKQFERVLEARPAVFSYIFGLLDSIYLKACRREKIYTIGAATTLDEAMELQESGVDAIVAQGVEAGGHRALFSAEAVDPQIPTLQLTRTLSQKLKIPVMASGGIMNGQGIAQALKAGAQAAQLGTAFLLAEEVATSQAYRQALLEKKRKTRLTRAFSGRWARGLENHFMLEMDSKPETILPFPIQNAFTRDLRNRASKLGNPEFLSLWAGTGVNEIRKETAAKLIEALFQELRES